MHVCDMTHAYGEMSINIVFLIQNLCDIYTFMCTQEHTSTSACMRIYVYAYMYTCVCIHVRDMTPVCGEMSIYIASLIEDVCDKYVYAYTRIYVYICV